MCGIEGLGRGKEMDARGGRGDDEGAGLGLFRRNRGNEREREGNKGWKVEIVLSRLDLQRGSSRDLGLFHQVHKNVPQDAFCCLVT